MKRRPGAGDLKTKALLRKRTDTPYGMGVEQQYEEVAVLHIKLEPVSAGMYFGGMQVGEKLTHRAYMRTIKRQIDTHCEVVAKGSVFRVLRTLDYMGDGVFTVLELEEIGNDQTVHSH